MKNITKIIFLLIIWSVGLLLVPEQRRGVRRVYGDTPVSERWEKVCVFSFFITPFPLLVLDLNFLRKWRGLHPKKSVQDDVFSLYNIMTNSNIQLYLLLSNLLWAKWDLIDPMIACQSRLYTIFSKYIYVCGASFSKRKVFRNNVFKFN